MLADFARTLSMLRKEKKISQRKAAVSLGVSQALLSHYENGVREPGLPFVVKASQFYGVSCDFLLGTSMNRDGAGINPDALIDMSETKDNVLRGSAFAMLNKKLLVNSIAIFIDLIGKTGNKELIQQSCNYLSVHFYKLFRLVYSCDLNRRSDVFPVEGDIFAEACDCEAKRTEMALKIIAREEQELKMSPEEITDINPSLSTSLFSLLHNTSEKISKKK